MILTARSPSPTASASPGTLAQLSRNASVISSSSSSSSSSSVDVLHTPTRERPQRAFSPPRSHQPSRHRSMEPVRRDPLEAAAAIAAVKPRPRIVLPTGGSRPADNGPPTPRPRGAPPKQLLIKTDFEFGDTLGEGSYSEVRRLAWRAQSLKPQRSSRPPTKRRASSTPSRSSRRCTSSRRTRSNTPRPNATRSPSLQTAAIRESSSSSGLSKTLPLCVRPSTTTLRHRHPVRLCHLPRTERKPAVPCPQARLALAPLRAVLHCTNCRYRHMDARPRRYTP